VDWSGSNGRDGRVPAPKLGDCWFAEKRNNFVGLVNVVMNRDMSLRAEWVPANETEQADRDSSPGLLPPRLRLGCKLGSWALPSHRVLCGTADALGYRHGGREHDGLMRRDREALLELLLHVVGAVLESSVAVLFVNGSVMLVRHLATVQDEA
jgi:hypothetical protein